MVAERRLDGTRVLERLTCLPGGAALLELAAGREDVELVGGAVRDVLLGREPRELDVVVADGAGGFGVAASDFAAGLAGRLGGELRAHERFGTAAVIARDARIDVATRRAESYPEPGALPRVGPGDGEQDLARRDFTVNAIALPLGGPCAGELRAVAHALADLRGGRLRVLHERSFSDDPTRLLRLCRYAVRLGFEVEPRTALRAREALARGALRTVSSARVGAELRLLLGEPDPLAALGGLERGGVLADLAPASAHLARAPLRLRLRPDTLAAALALLPADGRPDLLALASLLLDVPDPAVFELLDGWEYEAAERKVALEAATRSRDLAVGLTSAQRPSQLAQLLRGAAVETVALAAALGAESGRAAEWLGSLRHVRLEITGDDLVAAGVAPGPEVGRRLRRTLAGRLDGAIAPGRAAELRAALAAEAGA